MKAGNIEEKKIIVRTLINSGINVSPSILDFILQLKEPLKKVNLIIKETSFLPTFKGHLTTDVLKSISDAEIQKTLKRIVFKDQTKSATSNLKSKEKSEKSLINHNISIEKSESEQQPSLMKNKTKTAGTATKSLKKENYVQAKSKISKKIVPKADITTKSMGSSKSSLAFKPIAKNYNADFKILRDPTGKLYTDGSYNDFYDLTLDKFNKLRTLMRKRGDTLTANNINNILRITQKVEVAVIGMVNEIRQTQKGNYYFTLEDLSGLISVLVRKDSENAENFKEIEKTIEDQMLYISGQYNPRENGRKGIIYASYLTKIDIPQDIEPNKSSDPISIALISDTHIGSKEFEEKLWNRFIALINGKIGNKTQRELAGKIKYIIINGDLVDGIGIYPQQQKDLIITDIFKQYSKASELIGQIPEYIKVFYSSGNHDPVRNAIPRPAVPKKYTEELMNLGVKCLGNPSLIQTHEVNTLIYHGDSLLDMNMLIPGLDHDKPVNSMKELLKCRHLAPVYGKKTQIAPTNKDWLVIDKIPDIFHTGHLHVNDMGYYNNVALINSGCFQAQTDFMQSFGIHPTPGILSIINLDTLKGTQLDLKSSV